MKKSALLLCLGSGVLAAGVITPAVVLFGSEGEKPTQIEDDVKLVSNLFELNNVRAKVSSLAPTSSTYSSSEKGLLLYSYDSGNSATYKQILNGTTTFRSIASTKDKNTPDLTHYSYKITDLNTNDSFKIHVLTGEKVTTYYVEVDGKIAGETYFASINGLVLHGYTKLFNNSDTYTQVTSTGLNIDSKITFNPTDMSVVVEGQTKSFEVWNFKNPFIDGKAQIKHFDSFANYKVDIIFEEIIPNSKGELVLYEIGNKKFDGAILNNSTNLVADLSLKGVINKPYYLPTPLGEKAEDVSVWVYKEGNDGEPLEVMNGKLNSSNSFTPDKVGDYYVLYKTEDGELRDKINVISQEETTYSFSTTVLDNSNYGYKSVINVPDLVFTTNRSSNTLSSLVTIKLGNKTLVDSRKPGFDFTFDAHDKGSQGNTDYTFIYKCENNNVGEEIIKTVTTKSENGVSYFKPYLSDYAAGTTIDISKGYYYVNGQEYVCDVDVIYPSESKTVTYSAADFSNSLPQLTLEDNGTFTIRYHHDGAGANFVTTFRCMPKVDELFTTVDASTRFGTSSASDSNQGVIGSFKNDGEITYAKTIDATKLTKDTKLISLMAQPKVPGTAELNHIFVTVEDETDPDNNFEIRLSQGSGDGIYDKTFMRAQANGQKYGGYYFNSWFDIESNVAVKYWLEDLKFGETKQKSFNGFDCEVKTETIDSVQKMTFKVDFNAKNLHFLQENVTRSSFSNDLDEFIDEFDGEITLRLGNGRLTKAEVGTIHEPQRSWQADGAHDQGGFLHEHTFTGEMDTYSFESNDYLDLYYDYEDKALYTNLLFHVAGYQAEERIVKFCDFDDPKTFGADKVWGGFLTNKVKITVRATGVSEETGEVFIREICGNKFDNELLGDDDNPIIKIDDSVIPFAKVGTPFKPLDATYSDVTSAVENKTITVLGPDSNNVPLIDGKFTPTKVGNYTITYKASDSFGNTDTKSIVITAKNPDQFETFNSTINVESGKNVQYGINYELANPTITGGSGKYSIVKTVEVVDKNSQTFNLEVIDNRVKVLHSGVYTVKIKCIDYLGEVSENSYTFNSTFSSDPIYDDNLILPERLFKGVPYQIDQFTCKLFENEGEEQKEINLKAKVQDSAGTRVLGEDLLYTPECSGATGVATIELFATVGGNDIVVDTKDVEIFDLSTTEFVLDGYFKNDEHTSLKALYSSLLITCPDESQTMNTRFVSPITDSALSFEFSQYYTSGKNKASMSHIDSFEITLTDFEDSSISFVVKFTQKENGVYASLPGNGDSEYKVKNSFTDITAIENMGFSYSKSSFTIADISGATIGKVTKCSNGDVFEGFTSGKVLASFHASGVAKDNGVYLKKISDMSLGNSKVDNFAPSLIINGSYGGYVQENETVTLPTASAYDLLSYCGLPTLSIFNAKTKEYVKDVDGITLNKVPANKEYFVAFPIYGEYTVEYRATDSAGNEVVVSAYSYYVKDSEPATLTFTNELKEDSADVSLFSKINVADYQLNDNAGSENCFVYIYVVLPNSEVLTLKTYVEDKDNGGLMSTFTSNCPDGMFEFTGIGKYQLIYLITDSNGNICAITKTVNVK